MTLGDIVGWFLNTFIVIPCVMVYEVFSNLFEGLITLIPIAITGLIAICTVWFFALVGLLGLVTLLEAIF
jgi:hypothetical protein